MKQSSEQHRIVTFYSYKGGTGRSMALANFAWILAVAGQKVLAVDWDLEAPGLHRYFRPFLVDPDLSETAGLIDAFWDLASSTMASSQAESKPQADGKSLTDRFVGGEPPWANRAAKEGGNEAAEALEDTKRRLDWQFPSGGYIDFICAGRQNATYSQRVNTFDWKRFYEMGGAALIAHVKRRLLKSYNWVLIDSRTGVSDTSGICTMEMPDAVVACFTLNRQSIEGVRAVLTSIRESHSTTFNGSDIALFPVATRIENAEQARLELARGYAREALAKFLPAGYQSRPRDYWDKMEFAYRPAYAFEEVLAVFGDATGASGATDTMVSQVEAMAKCLTGDDTLSMPEMIDDVRDRVLAKYALGTPISPRPPGFEKKLPVVSDESDTEILRNVRAKEQVWRARKFWWKYLLSRREIGLLTTEDRAGFGRNMNYYFAQSEAMQKLMRTSNRGALIIWSLGLAAGLFMGWMPRSKLIFDPSVPYPPTGFLAAIIGFVVTVLLGVVMGGLLLSRDRPYGLRFLTMFELLLLGPLVREIQDYDPSTATTRSGDTAPTAA